MLLLSCSGWKEQHSGRDSKSHTADLLHDFQLLEREERRRGPCSAAVSSPEHLSIPHGKDPLSLPVRSPGLSRMGRWAPGRAPLSLSGPAVLSRLAQGRASSTMTPPQPPSEEPAWTLTGQLRVTPRTEYLWRTTVSSPPRTLAGATTVCWPALLPKCGVSPHQPCQSIKRITPHPPPGSVCVFFSYTWKGHLYCCSDDISTGTSNGHAPIPHPAFAVRL